MVCTEEERDAESRSVNFFKLMKIAKHSFPIVDHRNWAPDRVFRQKPDRNLLLIFDLKQISPDSIVRRVGMQIDREFIVSI